MPKFVDMPHGFCFDIEELLYYRVSHGDTWMEGYEEQSSVSDLSKVDKKVGKANHIKPCLLSSPTSHIELTTRVSFDEE